MHPGQNAGRRVDVTGELRCNCAHPAPLPIDTNGLDQPKKNMSHKRRGTGHQLLCTVVNHSLWSGVPDAKGRVHGFITMYCSPSLP